MSNRELIAKINGLSEEALRKVEQFIESLGPTPIGEAGSNLVAFKGLFSNEDLLEMKAAIEQDCERIDADGW